MTIKATKEMLAGNKVPDIQHTKAEVFILESLNEDDEREKRFEGQVISDMLRLCGKNPKYYYFQSVDELPHLIGLFRASGYRYLHMSTHASNTTIGTDKWSLPYARFADMFNGHLKLRRLFFSACQIGNKSFVDAVSSKNVGMHSIVAPVQDIQFDHAAAIWSAFYISMFTENENAMKGSDIEHRLKALRALFPVDFFMATYAPSRKSWTHKTITRP